MRLSTKCKIQNFVAIRTNSRHFLSTEISRRNRQNLPSKTRTMLTFDNIVAPLRNDIVVYKNYLLPLDLYKVAISSKYALRCG